MAISGSLRDVSVADVMQFVYIGRRTGSLQVSRGAETAMFLFDEGRLVRARSPHSQNVGDLLIQRGYLAAEQLRAAVALRKPGDEAQALGQLLLERRLISTAELGEALEVQIQQAINGVLNWEDGTFEFHVGEVETPDDFHAFNEILVPRDGFNPQLLLLEAAHIFDQRGDSPAEPREPVGAEGELSRLTAAAAMGDALRTTEGWRRSLDAFFAGAGGPRALTELWWVSQDGTFFRGLSEALVAQPVQTRRVTSASAHRLDPTGPEPLIFVDLRGGGPAFHELEALRRSHLDATVVAIGTPEADAARIFAAGAQALLPADPSAIVAFVERLLAEPRSAMQREMSASGMQRLRRVYEELRAGLTSATVALTLMRLISESFDRAVLLLPKREAFSVLGAFGLGAGGRPLAVAMRGLVLRNDGDDAFSRTLRGTNLHRLEPEPGSLPAEFRRVLGEPFEHQSVFPVGGAEKVIALVYADNEGRLPDDDMQILELAAAQVGIALENELLRRHT
jgi:hypothetical protein